MSGIIAASQVIQPTIILEAEGSTGLSINLMMLGSVSINPGNDENLSIYSTDDSVYNYKQYNYAQPYTGNILIRGNLNLIKYFNFENYTTSGLIKVPLTEVAKMENLKTFAAGWQLTYVYGDVNELPKHLEELYVVNGLLSGQVADLPRTLLDFQSSTENSITGNIADLPPNMKIFGMQGNTTMVGNIADLPNTLEILWLNGNYSLDIKGFIADIPASVKNFNFSVLGNGFLNGDLSSLKEGIIGFNVGGNCTITGDLSNFPTSLLAISINSQNPQSEITGNLLDLSREIIGFDFDINNHITGDIANIPPLIAYFGLAGQNTVYGNIGDIQPIMEAIFLNGDNTVTGDIADIKANLNTIRLRGFNTIYGNISDLPSSLVNVDVTGYNELTGDVANMPQNIAQLDIRGKNTLYGNLGDLQKNVIRIIGYSTCTYSQTVWRSPMYELTYTPYTTGLTAAEVNQLLIDLSATEWDVFKVIDIRGVNAPRTAASNAAVALLQIKGVTVLTN